jgi:YidC/Oxa1 family membrane protein insertase
MNPWFAFVEVVRFALFAAAHLFGGGIGAATFAFSLAIRVALLPITMRAARRMREQREKLRALKPELDRLTKKFGTDLRRLHEARASLFRERGIDVKPELSSSLVQAPITAALFATLRASIARNTRFLWIRDLTRPDVVLATVAAGIAGVAARFGGADNPRVAMILSATLAFIFAWRFSASVALYSIAWNGVTAAESLALEIAGRRTHT